MYGGGAILRPSRIRPPGNVVREGGGRVLAQTSAAVSIEIFGFFVDLVAGRVEKRWTPALWVEQNGVV
jgi:hypothetical protein